MADRCTSCDETLPVRARFCPGCGRSLLAAGTAETSHTETDHRPRTPYVPPRLIAPGTTITDRYSIDGVIGEGGMGVVYRARQVSLNRIVAVKMLLFGKFSSDEFVKRFHTEAEAAASLQHPNIVAINEVGEHEGQHYLSMDYVAGKSLAELVRDGPLPARCAAGYIRIIAEAIHYAHQGGILHRDLKPSNVLIDEFDQPRITDFGLAKRLLNSKLEAQDTELTVTGQVLARQISCLPSRRTPNAVSSARPAMFTRSARFSTTCSLAARRFCPRRSKTRCGNC